MFHRAFSYALTTLPQVETRMQVISRTILKKYIDDLHPDL